MTGGARRFVLGVEGLTALVTGASALAAIVAFLVLWLVVSDARTTLESASYSRAEYISSALGIRPTQSSLESIVSSSIPGGGVTAVAVVFDNSEILAYPTITQEDLSIAEQITYPSPNGYRVTLLMKMPSALGGSNVILLLFAVFAVILTVVAILVPSFLRRTVLDPLRSILGEANRYREGSGDTAKAAKASFSNLVDLLGERDRQLEQLRVDALNRALAAESRSGAVLDALGSSVIVFDSTGTPSLWNRQAADNFKIGTEQKAADGFLKHFSNYLNDGVTEWDGEENGRILRFKVTPGENGEWIALVTDVTAPVMLERKLAEESALADLGALSGGVAHEIGNALCALDGFLELLGRGGDSERKEGILEEAGIELDSARKIVEAFRNLAQQNTVESTTDTETAVSLIKDICESHSLACSVSTAENGGKSIIPGGDVLIARTMENILSNALRVSRKSDVVVTVDDSSVEHAFIFRVMDRGPGLPDPPEQVFRPMYTTAEDQGGMGLGLTITRRLVRAMGGSVKAENRKDGGAVFTIIIPYLESN